MSLLTWPVPSRRQDIFQAKRNLLEFNFIVLISLLLGGCLSASTPTIPSTQAQADVQPTIQGEQHTNTVNPAPGLPRSDGEIIGDLDRELDESIAVFDGMILDERAKAEAIEASINGDTDGQNGDQDGSGGGQEALFEDGDIYEGLPGYGDFPEGPDGVSEDDQQASAEGGDTGNNSTAYDSDNEAGGKTDKSSGLETAKSGGIPADIESGSDDDIVARQIREAALKEKDPILRDKLWDEYRKYKNQQRAE